MGEQKVHELDIRLTKLESIVTNHGERMEHYETISEAHMKKEDARWEKIELHMTKMNRLVYIGIGIGLTIIFLWTFFKDVMRLIA